MIEYTGRRLKIKFIAIANAIFLIFLYYFSYLYSSAYQFGDQIFYRDFYSNLYDTPIEQIPSLQYFYTGSAEPLFGLISWVGAQLSIEKDIYFSIINTLFGFVLLRYLQKNTVNVLYITLTFLNYYLFVMLGPAERLKIAFLFILVAINLVNRPAIYVLISGALLSHFQTFILLGSRLFGLIYKVHLSALRKKKLLARLLVGVVAASVLAAWFLSSFLISLLAKIEAYGNPNGVFAISNILVLMLISAVVLRQKIEVLLILTATAVAAMVLGPERINMVAFFLFSYFVIQQRKTGHPAILTLMTYFAIKGILFVADVFENGTGY